MDFVISSFAAWTFPLSGSQQRSGDSGLANKSGVSLVYNVTVNRRKTAEPGFTNKIQSRDNFTLEERKGQANEKFYLSKEGSSQLKQLFLAHYSLSEANSIRTSITSHRPHVEKQC